MTELRGCSLRVKIVTKMDWPSFMNVATQVRKSLSRYCTCTIYDRTSANSGGNVLFIGTVFHQTLNYLGKFLGRSNIVFYGTTEGHSFLDETSLQIAKQIKIVAVSNFVKQMLKEVNVPVAGVVHHGLDMNCRRVDTLFYKILKNKFHDKKVIFTVAANHSRKGLDNLLQGFSLVENEVRDAYLILHSEQEGYYNLSRISKSLPLKRLWLTNLYGKLSQSKLNALYKLCSVYVQPSYSEGFGLPILEAFRFHKPVVAVDAPPLNEIIKNDETGILVPSTKISWFNFANMVFFKMHIYKAEDLASAVLKLMRNQQLEAKMQESVQREKRNWDIHELYPKLLSYF
jgi:glycosyltransferase involved in cell wall biosynthesis